MCGLIRFYQLEITCEESGKVLVSWSPPPPPGNSARDGYKLVVKKKGDTKEVLQRKPGRGEDKIELETAGVLLPAVEYVFSLYTTARAEAESETDALGKPQGCLRAAAGMPSGCLREALGVP